MKNFVKRSRDPELMDDRGMDSDILKKVLYDVDRANRMLGGHQITLRGVEQLVRKYPQESYTIVDMGCGNGGILREVVKLGRRMGVSIAAIGVDLSEKCLAIARSASTDFPEIQYMQRDILQLAPKDLHGDIVLCTLTMHHFFDENIPVFLDRFAKLARIGVVINDLQRSPLAYYLFRGFSAIFIRTKIAKHDGLISIKSGFTKAELQRFAENLPSVDHDIKWKWAFRYAWVMHTRRLNESYE